MLHLANQISQNTWSRTIYCILLMYQQKTTICNTHATICDYNGYTDNTVCFDKLDVQVAIEMSIAMVNA